MEILRPLVAVLIGMAMLTTRIALGQQHSPQSAPEFALEQDTELPEDAPAPKQRARGGAPGGPGMGPPGYSATWYPAQAVSDSAADVGFVRQSLSGAFPIWRDDGDMVFLMASVRNSLFSTDAVLPDTRRPFPHELWNVSLGLMYLHEFDNGWTSGLSTTFGSASDQPFNSTRELNVGFFGFLQVPVQNDRDAWMFSLMYSPVGNLNFPIPGIAYSWKPSDDLNVNFGIPFSVMWKPATDLTLNFSYIPVTNINARATYRVKDGLNVYGGFEWLNEAYFLADRAERKDRFLVIEKRLISGIRWDIATHVAIDLSAGYAFDRFYAEGQSQFSNLRDRIDVAPGPFAGASLLLRW